LHGWRDCQLSKILERDERRVPQLHVFACRDIDQDIGRFGRSLGGQF
jgi:hypothetical protein